MHPPYTVRDNEAIISDEDADFYRLCAQLEKSAYKKKEALYTGAAKINCQLRNENDAFQSLVIFHVNFSLQRIFFHSWIFLF